jgi:hypothetical protein
LGEIGVIAETPQDRGFGYALNASLNAKLTIPLEKVAGNLGKGGYESDSS